MERFDIIIVGGGAAGCVLANRLSEQEECRVLLIEAGPSDRHPMIHMPKGVGRILSDPRYIWPFRVGHAEGANVPPAFWVRGKTLGGSSSTNGMMYVRGQPADYADFAAATSEDWNWSAIEAAYDGVERYLKVSQPVHHQSALDRVIAAAESLGLARADDSNRPDDRAKVGYCPQTVWRGRRQSAAVAFLDPVRRRANLTVRTGLTVDRVVFERGRATGVEVIGSAGREVVAANRIILAGGTFGSPAVLQRSGIGDAGLLKRLGIDAVVDRPAVGRNLFEHCAITVQWRLNAPMSRNADYGGWRLGLHAARWFVARGGPLGTATFDVGGWFSTDGSSRPNAQFLAAPHSIDRSKKTMATEPFPGMQMVIYPLRPRARGSIAITSRDPEDLPTGALDYFADADDRRELVETLRWIRRLAATAPLADIIAEETRPGPQVAGDDEIIEAYRVLGTPGYHAAGTCRMGADSDAVVDCSTRVNGVEGLHVVDLSIAPVMPAGNTFGPVCALAWRAADLIIAQHHHDLRGTATRQAA